MLDVEAIRQRLLAATPGPWTRHGADVHAEGVPGPLLRGNDGSPAIREQADADAELVAHAPADIAALLGALVALASPAASAPAAEPVAPVAAPLPPVAVPSPQPAAVDPGVRLPSAARGD